MPTAVLPRRTVSRQSLRKQSPPRSPPPQSGDAQPTCKSPSSSNTSDVYSAGDHSHECKDTTLDALSALLNTPHHDSPPPPPTPKPWIRSPTSSSASKVDWTVRPNPVYEEVGYVEEGIEGVPDEVQWKIAYTPTRKFDWAVNQGLILRQTLKALDSTNQCRTDLMQGVIGKRLLTFVCKRYRRTSVDQVSSVYKEIKLFGSSAYLRDLQGSVVSSLINIYDDFHHVYLILEPPHHSFWVEASANMSNALKKRIVNAYIALHKAGVLHGDVSMRNIVIGGDGRVTLINFSNARSTRPIPEIGLDATSRREMAWELRKVMYLLDYDGAWRIEENRQRRASEMLAHNHGIKELRKLRLKGVHNGPIQSYADPLWEDNDNPPPCPEEWEEWYELARVPPRRHVVPGQTAEQFTAATAEYHASVRRLEMLDANEAASPILISMPGIPLPVRNPSSSCSDVTIPDLDNDARKRKLSLLDSDPETDKGPAKRSRNDDVLPLPSVRPAPSFEFSSKSYSTGTSDHLLPAASSSFSKASPPPVKVRDFADTPYHGPRGYYVPYPPNEFLMASNRLAHIRNSNAIECGRLGLPYWRAETDSKYLQPPSYRHCPPRHMHVAIGPMKRRRAEAEGKAPGEAEECRVTKRMRFLEDREVALNEDRPIRFDDHVTYFEPWMYDRHGWRTHPPPKSSRHRWTSARTVHGIMKRTSPRRTVSFDLRNYIPYPPTEEPIPTPIRELSPFGHDPERSLDSTPGRHGTEATELERIPPTLSLDTSITPTDATVSPDTSSAESRSLGANSVGNGRAGSHRRSHSHRMSADELEELEVERLLTATQPDVERGAEDDDGSSDSDTIMLTDIWVWLNTVASRW